MVAARRSAYLITTGGYTRLRPKHSLAGVTRQPKHCASTSRWCSLMAVRTVLRIRSALIVKPVPTLSAHLRASTTHAALVILANEMARWFGEGPPQSAGTA